ncbi:MAG TPA: hypothetical protein VLM18_07240 [Croceibacterium sp.]|nr:hypothetical protein [Croceibacterium sp.]
MTRAIAYARQIAVDRAEAARRIIVAACALALIAAGQVLPF